MNAIATPTVQAGWSAELELQFERHGDRTLLTRNRHLGPLRVQRPFYPETGGQCHVYVLHPPGGIVAGDSLQIHARVASGAHALMTTPAAGRVYRSNQQRLRQSQAVQLTVDDDGFCEWLPQENILFDGAEGVNSTRIDLQGRARCIAWEITCLGRPASQQWFVSGSLLQSLSLYRDGVPLLLERNRFDGGSALLQAPWGLQGQAALGTLLISGGDESLLQQLKALCAEERQWAVTRMQDLIIVRGLAGQAAPLRTAFMACWRLARKHLLQVEPVAPRIWFT